MTFITSPLMKSFVGFDNLFDEFDRISNFKDQSYPAYDIKKVSDTDYKISLALAGFSENDINAEMKDGILTVTASSNEDDYEANTYIHRGIAKRPFSRQFRLAENIEVVDAELTNGMLIISLHKNIPEAEKPKQITIRNSVKSLSKKAA